MIDYILVGNCLVTLCAIKSWDRDPPHTLPRHAPIRTALQHVSHAIASPPRYPGHAFNFPQRTGSQTAAFVRTIHRNKPLRSSAKNYRIVTPPAMRITMRILFGKYESSGLAQELNDMRISLEDRLAGKALNLVCKTARIIHRTVNLRPLHLTTEYAIRSKLFVDRSQGFSVLLSDHEVIVAMTRSGMNTAGACFSCGLLLSKRDIEFGFCVRLATQRHVLTKHQ